jgi:hypothetical protein
MHSVADEHTHKRIFVNIKNKHAMRGGICMECGHTILHPPNHISKAETLWSFMSQTKIPTEIVYTIVAFSTVMTTPSFT